MGTVVTGLGMFLGFFAINQERRQLENALELANNQTAKPKPSTAFQVRFNCREIKHQMHDYLAVVNLDDAQLNPAQRELISDFSQHLELCSKCSEMVNDALNA